MDEMELKTSTKQRVAISIIAIIMLGSVIASYVAIVASGSRSSAEADTSISEEKMKEYEEAYAAKLVEFKSATAGDYDKFSKQLSVISKYDETTANSGGVVSRDLVGGSGRELTDGDTDYLAYYVGWCADGSIFDSSLDDKDNPTGFSKVLSASNGMIEGWSTGVVGMKLGGIREITVPGEKAYGSSMEICGGYDKPLKFLIMAMANEDPLKANSAEVDTAYLKVQYAHYGIDYEKITSK